jgi:hypothetical protein
LRNINDNAIYLEKTVGTEKFIRIGERLELYCIRLDGILNKLENSSDGFTIKEYYLLIIQFKFFLFLIILKIVVNLQILHIIIIGDPSCIHRLSKVIECWLEIIDKRQCWKVTMQNLLKRDYLNLLLQ